MTHDLSLTQAARRTPPTTLTDSEAMIDLAKMRRYRQDRVRAELAARDIAACVLTNPLSIRYACGVRNGALFQTHITSAYLFLPAEGPAILFDAGGAAVTGPQLETVDEAAEEIIPLSYMFAGARLAEWAERWAGQMAALVAQHGGGNRRLAVERAGTAATLALAALDVEVLEGSAVVEAARNIKSPEEVLCMNHALAVAEAGAWRLREALCPGITETQLWAQLWAANIEAGGDWIECRLLTSGDRANPWLQEAGSRVVRPGELVSFDTDMIGPLGYAADFSRTLHCGPGRPSPEQRELYKRAYDEVHHNLELMQPGATFHEITERSFRQPEAFLAQRYPVLAHGIGMSDEWPCIFYRQDAGAFAHDGALEPGMAICVESYVGAVGGHEGVKLEQQILITEDGHEVLSRFPFEESLLA